MSSPPCVPVFDVHSNRQDGLLGFQAWFYDDGKANRYTTTHHAAGSVCSPPFPSSSPPPPAIYAFDQWTAMLNTDCPSNIYAACPLGIPVSDPSLNCGSRDSELSSCNSSYVILASLLTVLRLTAYLSTPPSLMASPLGGDSPLYFTSPDLLLHALSSPFKVNDVGSQDLAAPVRPYHDHAVAWPLPVDTPRSMLPEQHLPLPFFLPENRITTDVPVIANQSLHNTVANHLGALPGNFIAPPTSLETTALGLYYPDTTQSPDSPLVLAKAEDNAPIPCDFQCSPRPAENWTFRAVDPAKKASRPKRAQSDKARPSDAPTAASTTATTAPGIKVDPLIECKQCGYLQLTKRMGDFRRHLKKHEQHLSRVICCGVPPTHPAAARLRPEHLTHWYDDHPFHGGCGRTYSRMDALQRHLKKSGCVGGNAKDHQSWRKLYFLDKTRRPCKPAESSVP